MFSGRELDVMNALWDLGSATVSEVLDTLPDDLAYTTVLTILQRLKRKGHVRHEDEGQAHRYFPLVLRETVRQGRASLSQRGTGSGVRIGHQLGSLRVLRDGREHDDHAGPRDRTRRLRAQSFL